MKLEPGRLLLGVMMMSVGVLHFTHTKMWASIVPDYLPAHEALVLISGVFEIALGVGVLVERTRALAAWGLVALYVAVFPANLNMALHPDAPIAGVDVHVSPLALWLRLPLQLALIYWAYRYTKPRALAATS